MKHNHMKLNLSPEKKFLKADGGGHGLGGPPWIRHCQDYLFQLYFVIGNNYYYELLKYYIKKVKMFYNVLQQFQLS